MEYLKPSFSVNLQSPDYSEGWDRIFGKKGLMSGRGKVRALHRDTSDLRKQVEEFHKAFSITVESVPDIPDSDVLTLRLRLIAEEFFELLDACGVDHGMTYDSSRMSPINDVDIVEAADALADLDYVIEGTRLAFGINGKPIAEEVHRSNMTKLDDDGKPVYRDDGKVTKGPNFTPPDIAKELIRQGWNP